MDSFFASLGQPEITILSGRGRLRWWRNTSLLTSDLTTTSQCGRNKWMPHSGHFNKRVPHSWRILGCITIWFSPFFVSFQQLIQPVWGQNTHPKWAKSVISSQSALGKKDPRTHFTIMNFFFSKFYWQIVEMTLKKVMAKWRVTWHHNLSTLCTMHLCDKVSFRHALDRDDFMSASEGLQTTLTLNLMKI